MRSRTKKWLIAALLVLIPLWVLGDPPVYFAKEIRGQVVDEASGQPVEGAVIVAEWKLYSEGIGSGGHGGSLNTLETVTDKEGRYAIPGWGPRPRPPFAFLDYFDPEIVVFKAEFYPQRLSNEIVSSANRNRAIVRTSQWSSQVIRLRRFEGNWSDYAFKLSTLWSPSGHCLRECPQLVLALDRESKRIKQLAPREPFIPTVMNIDHLGKDDQEFLRSVQNELSKK